MTFLPPPTTPTPSPARPRVTVTVIGAGIVGCCIAYELQKRGALVTLIDRDTPGQACSLGNSGAISTSSVVPLAMPGVIAALPGMLLDRDSPLYLPLPHLPKATPWLVRFVLSARKAHVRKSVAALTALHRNAVQKHRTLTQEVGVPELFLQQGHLHLYPDRRALDGDAQSWEIRRQQGVQMEQLSRSQIVELEPQIGERYQNGIFLADHATILNPGRYVEAIARRFVERGGVFRQVAVSAMQASASGWSVHSDSSVTVSDHVVVATGAWAPQLLGAQKLSSLVESQRGYHVQYGDAHGIVSRTVVLADRKVFITPMEMGLRIGGTVEFAGLSPVPNARRSAVLARIATETFPQLKNRASTSWMGHRPCRPDSVPLIGAVAGRPGLWTAVGHGHLGLTDSINTATRIADDMGLLTAPATARAS